MIKKLVTPSAMTPRDSQFSTLPANPGRFRVYVRPNKHEVTSKVGSEYNSRPMTARNGNTATIVHPAKQGTVKVPGRTPRRQDYNTNTLIVEERPSKMQQLKIANSLDPESYRAIVTTNVPKYVSTTKGNKIPCMNTTGGLGEKCIGCSICLSPSHQLINYKYPHKINSRYNEFHNSKPSKLQLK